MRKLIAPDVRTFRRLCLLVLLGVGLAFTNAGRATAIADTQPDIEVFVRKGCPHCTLAKRFLDELGRERPALTILVRDIQDDPAARERLEGLAERFHVSAPGVPAFYLRGELIIGFDGAGTTGRRIAGLVDRPSRGPRSDVLPGACPSETETACAPPALARERPEGIEVPVFGHLSVEQLGLPLFTFAIGLLDGFNPCSMWVLLLMLSLLANLRDRVKMLLIAGTFVAVEGLAYFLFMAAWLNAFRFIGLSRASEVIMGGIALGFGVVHLKDAWAFGRGFTLGIPDTAKPTVYARLRRIMQAENLPAALLGTVVLAVLVQAVELLCTSGFPATYTRILTMRALETWAYYGHLLLYNVAYMLDDVVVLGIGVVTLSQRRLQEAGGRRLKLVTGLVMAGLGLVMIVRPEWLAG